MRFNSNILSVSGTAVQKILSILDRSNFASKQLAQLKLDGLDFSFRPFFADELFMALGVWEPCVRREIVLQLGDVFLDAGAHIGFYTMLAARKVGNRGLVIAVEPDPRNITLLRKNVYANDLKNVRIIEAALTNVDGTVPFSLAGNPMMSQVGDLDWRRYFRVISVHCISIESLVRELKIKKIDIMKIDVELGDYQVLLGAERTLSKVKRIIIEASKESLSFMRDNGFKITHLTSNYYLGER